MYLKLLFSVYQSTKNWANFKTEYQTTLISENRKVKLFSVWWNLWKTLDLHKLCWYFPFCLFYEISWVLGNIKKFQTDKSCLCNWQIFQRPVVVLFSNIRIRKTILKEPVKISYQSNLNFVCFKFPSGPQIYCQTLLFIIDFSYFHHQNCEARRLCCVAQRIPRRIEFSLIKDFKPNFPNTQSHNNDLNVSKLSRNCQQFMFSETQKYCRCNLSNWKTSYIVWQCALNFHEY